MSFECCILCKPPKRYPGCHDHCPEYAKAKHDQDAANQRRTVNQGINAQKIAGVNRAIKKRKGGK